VETDKEMTAVLRAEFSILNEANRKKVRNIKHAKNDAGERYVA
jgi:hypothetical protein